MQLLRKLPVAFGHSTVGDVVGKAVGVVVEGELLANVGDIVVGASEGIRVGS